MISERERALIGELIIFPGRRETISNEEFLERWGADDGFELGLSLLEAAIDSRSAVDLEYALIVCKRFGLTSVHLPLLIAICNQEWHHDHEDIVSRLGSYQDVSTIEELYKATQWIPKYLEFDDSRALAVKAIWALGGIDDRRALTCLRKLSRSTDETLSLGAKEQLQLKGTASS